MRHWDIQLVWRIGKSRWMVSWLLIYHMIGFSRLVAKMILHHCNMQATGQCTFYLEEEDCYTCSLLALAALVSGILLALM